MFYDCNGTLLIFGTLQKECMNWHVPWYYVVSTLPTLFTERYQASVAFMKSNQVIALVCITT